MKNQIRKNSLAKRKFFPVEELSKKIIENLYALEEYKKSQNILCYYPLKYEVQTQECFNDSSKNWFLPRVNKSDLEVCPYCSDNIQKGSFGILEPLTEKIDSIEFIDLVIIPAVAVDINGYRIGYGKGFYDRFLSSFKSPVIKIVLEYSDLVYTNIYPDNYDVKVDIIVTEKEIFKINC